MPRRSRVTLIKGALFVAALLPFTHLVVFAFADRLGANPLEVITHDTGDWTLRFLCLTLSLTPLRHLTGASWLLRMRRMLGLYAFFYATLHFTAFLWFDHFFDVDEMAKDVLARPFITAGFTAFLLLLPLAATSTDAMIRRLGGRRWRRLHRLVYLIAVLGVLHYWWMKAGKHDLAEPVLFASIVGLLLMLRLYRAVVQPWLLSHRVAPTAP